MRQKGDNGDGGYDELIEQISGNGRYQNFLIILSMAMMTMIAFEHTGSVFLLGLPPSRCWIDDIDNNSTNLTNDFLTKTFVPFHNVKQSYDRCHYYKYNLTACRSNLTEVCIHNATTSQHGMEMPCKNGYHYDRSTFQETITTEFDLVCNDLTIMTLTSSVYYVGLFFGATIGGMLSDRFGRILICKVSTILWLSCSVGLSFSPNVYLVLVFRFLLALCFMPTTVSLFVYASEISKKKIRPSLGSLSNAFFGSGCVIMSGMAYHWSNWRTLQIVFTLSSIPFVLPNFGVLPKSPRWLLSKGKTDEALRVCSKMARRNKGKFSQKLINEVEMAVSDKKSETSVLDFVKRPYSRFMLFSNCIIWLVTSLIFYGLALNSGNLAGNVYVNHALGGVMEFSACLLCIPFLMTVGRKSTTVGTLLVASITCLLSTICIQFKNGNEAVGKIGVVLAMVGRFSSSATFAVIYQHTVEMYPTSGRATALGISSTAARLGSIITPFTLQLQYEVPWLTQTIFGIAALLAAILASCFPETKGKPLLSNFDEAEEVFKAHLAKSWVSKLVAIPTAKKRLEVKKDALVESESSV